MKRNSIRFHEKRTWTVSLAATYAVLSFLLLQIIALIGDNTLGRMITLKRSDYLYSVKIADSVGQDDYLQFDAAIGFTQEPDSSAGLNADVVMQASESIYTTAVAWNAEKLLPYEIAISGDFAKKYELKVGDVLYSKHIVDGKQCQYTITAVLPYVSSVRPLETKSYTEGLIIMGYDNLYAQNLVYDIVAFTNESIESLTQKHSQTPVGIEYRDDAIKNLKRQLAPYLIVLVLLGGMLTMIFAWGLILMISCDLKRLIILGFEKRCLSKSFWIYAIWPFILSIICVAIAFATVLQLTKLQSADICFAAILAIVESVTFIITVCFMERKAWRS